MQPHEHWFVARNLPAGSRLEGESLLYALTTFLLHPEEVPEGVLVALAEGPLGYLSGVDAH